jgi:hypothetical protein
VQRLGKLPESIPAALHGLRPGSKA